MSLLDELRAIENFPPSHAPTQSEVLDVVGKLVAYIEHGDKLTKAAAADAKKADKGQVGTGVPELLAGEPTTKAA